MKDYKEHIQCFFMFYAIFNYQNVISVHHGRTFEMNSWERSYPSFMASEINIPGPINREKNCQNIKKDEKEKFIKLCEFSAECLSDFTDMQMVHQIPFGFKNKRSEIQ